MEYESLKNGFIEKNGLKARKHVKRHNIVTLQYNVLQL